MQVEVPLVGVLVDMEAAGMALDVGKLRRQGEPLLKRIKVRGACAVRDGDLGTKRSKVYVWVRADS